MMRGKRRGRWVVLFFVAAVAGPLDYGCVSSEPGASSPGDAGTFAGYDATVGVPDAGADALVAPRDAPSDTAQDARALDASLDAAQDAPSDASLDAPPDAVTVAYGDFADAASWSTFDPATLDAGAAGFAAAVFDGRYIYFVPFYNGVTDGIVTRYDTKSAGGFDSVSSWVTFDLTRVSPAAKGFAGGAFDGRYVYFIPYGANTPSITFTGTLTRYDTQAAGGFGDTASYATFDLTTIDPTAQGYIGGAFDGRYLYLGPFGSSLVMRVDVSNPAAFTDAGSYAKFDTTSVAGVIAGGQPGYDGVGFDGRYVYLAPWGYAGPTYGGVLRFDTQGVSDFRDAGSYAIFDTTTLTPKAAGFQGASFDGQYIYFAPASGGVVARYDSKAPFSDGGSYSTFDLGTVVDAGDAGPLAFAGTRFDGRFVYFVPFTTGVLDGQIFRYDTQADAGFTGKGAYSTFDPSLVNPKARGWYQGAIFDGRYMYFVPYGDGTPGGVVLRYDAKTPPSVPPGSNASFY